MLDCSLEVIYNRSTEQQLSGLGQVVTFSLHSQTPRMCLRFWKSAFEILALPPKFAG